PYILSFGIYTGVCLSVVGRRIVLQKAMGYIELMRPIYVLMASLAVFVGGIVGGYQFQTIGLFFAMIVVFLMTAGSMAINDYFDRNIDQIAHPDRPLPSGKLSSHDALYFSFVSFSIAVGLSVAINISCFGIVVTGLVLMMIYERYYKNIGFIGNLLTAFIIAMALILGGAAVGNVHDTLLLAFMAFFIMLGREIFMDVKDVEGDSAQRVTLPMTIGIKNALYMGGIFIAVAVALTPLPYWWNALSVWYIVIIVPADIFFLLAILTPLKDITNIGISIQILLLNSGFALLGFILGIVG
ncbi:MAG: UbiA family prenyltransferase, partial [Thermoplasmatota archaeon]